MSSHQHSQLTIGNRIYLYNLLRSSLGIGRQAFITQAEEALAADGLSAEDLGFEDARALMEALDDFVTLTVFKGGRVYVTLVDQPAWNEALDAAADAGKAAGGKAGKPWKRKKGPKALKPARPRIVSPAPEPDSATETASSCNDAGEPALADELETESDQATVENTSIALADARASENVLDGIPSIETTSDKMERQETPLPDTACETVAPPARDFEQKLDDVETLADQPAPEPAFSLTVTFDPEHADAGETKLESTPILEPETLPESSTERPIAESTESAVAPIESEPEPKPIDVSIYPQDFAEEVYCPAPVMRELAQLLPYGADILELVGEYFYLACERETADFARNRASFPLRYRKDGERLSATVTIKKRPAAKTSWIVESVELPD